MIWASFGMASAATVYLKDRSKFMLSATANKKSYDVLLIIMFNRSVSP
jgi:hypothetical protein